MRTCSQCGVVAGAASQFRGGVCLSCREALRPDVEARLAVTHVVVFATAVLGWLFWRDTAWAPLVMVAVFVAAFDVVGMVVVAVHEAAHAVTAVLLGRRVTEVHVGIGPEVFAFGRSPRIHVHLVPLGGSTHPEGGDLGRLEAGLIVLAGPLGHVPVALLAWSLVPPDPMWLPSRGYVVVYILVQAVYNLLPLADHDGRTLLDLAWMSADEVPALVRSHEAGLALQQAQVAGAAPDRSVREQFLTGLEEPSSPHKRALDLNNLAFTDLLLEDDQLVDEALDASRKAMDLFPDHPAIRNTHGLALIAAGHDDDGIPLVTSTLSHADADEVGLCHSLLALAQARRGNAHAARQHVARLRGLGHDDRWLRQAVRLLGPLEAKVVGGYLATSGTPAEAAATLAREAGPVATVIGEVLLEHLDPVGGHGDLRTVAAVLAGR